MSESIASHDCMMMMMMMTNKLERMWEELAVTQSKAISLQLPGKIKNNETTKDLKIVGVPSEFRTEYLSNTSHELHYISMSL
jgi:hypothetical protein